MMRAACGGQVGSRAVIRGAAVVMAALALVGCESSQEQSARLERVAKLAAAHETRVNKGLTIARESTDVKVLSANVVTSSEGAVAVVTVRNDSSWTLASVPIAIDVRNARGQTLFQNEVAGLEPALTAISLVPAHGEAMWVDDQLPRSGQPASVAVRIGEVPAVSGPTPRIEVQGLHPEEAGAGAAGTVRNRSHVAQRRLVVFVVARRAGRLVAAGRAVLAELSPGASAPFQVFFVGSAAGASLRASAPATTLG
ncbi:MAG TPA: hypothetical protein VK252_02015 [Solirubrobacteraceae bacterium]|nr:hypothetical protein [Solirubrobacteraceae bacterium]